MQRVWMAAPWPEFEIYQVFSGVVGVIIGLTLVLHILPFGRLVDWSTTRRLDDSTVPDSSTLFLPF
jgi:hypothetical protein